MSHWRLFYHVVWATRGREPLLDEVNGQTVERSLRATCHELRGPVHAIGVMPDHAHLAVSIPPSIAISAFVKQLKGSSSHLLNHSAAEADAAIFAWQAEFGVYSFGEKNLPDVVAYVDNQPARHAAGHLWPDLERTETAQPAKESSQT